LARRIKSDVCRHSAERRVHCRAYSTQAKMRHVGLRRILPPVCQASKTRKSGHEQLDATSPPVRTVLILGGRRTEPLTAARAAGLGVIYLGPGGPSQLEISPSPIS